nr:hypothetical protein [Wolbachia endosymbiont of Atemnus politus]
MDFIIHDKSVDKILIKAVINRDKEEFDKIWEKYCEGPEIPSDKKTDQYKEEIKKFYDLGKEHIHLLPKEETGNYRPFAKEVFKEMFKYTGTKVPSDSILEELVTNCNQAGYEAALFTEVVFKLNSYDLTSHNPVKVMNIDCIDINHITVKSDMVIPVVKFDNPEEKLSKLSSSLEFTLESQDGKDGVTYTNGNLLLTVPRELKNYKVGDKNLFNIIKEYFQKFCEKLGFKFEVEIEHDLGDPMEVKSSLENVEPPVHGNEHGNAPGPGD